MSAAPIMPPAVRPTFIDLFCGCGGFTLGLQRAGFDCHAAVDFNAEAVATLRANLQAKSPTGLKPVGFGHRERGVKLEFSFSRASPCCSGYPSRPHGARPPSSSSS